jgi:hypothetical protein
MSDGTHRGGLVADWPPALALRAGRWPAAAVWAAALGLGLSRPLRRVLARARQRLLGGQVRGDRMPAAPWCILAQGLVLDDRGRAVPRGLRWPPDWARLRTTCQEMLAQYCCGLLMLT